MNCPFCTENEREAFYETPFTLCLVNIKPILPGHILVIPKRHVSRFQQLTTGEITDLMLTIQDIEPILLTKFKATAMHIGLQDGQAAHQSIEHLHFHVVPRKEGDSSANEFYDQLHTSTENRRPRPIQKTKKEAEDLRKRCNSIKNST